MSVPSIDTYTPRNEASGMTVTRAMLFDRPTELRARTRKLARGLYDVETEMWTADYRRLRFVAKRSDGL